LKAGGLKEIDFVVVGKMKMRKRATTMMMMMSGGLLWFFDTLIKIGLDRVLNKT
jgi:hypothetical protein